MKKILVFIFLFGSLSAFASDCKESLDEVHANLGNFSQDFEYDNSLTIFGLSNFATRNFDMSLSIYEKYLNNNRYGRRPLDYDSIETATITLRNLQKNYLNLKLKLMLLEGQVDALENCLN